MMMSVCKPSTNNGGLSHLVEAATVLAQLNGGASETVKESAATKQAAPSVKKDGAKKPQNSAQTKKEIFPQRLMAILNDPSLSDVVTWLPHGSSFVILRPDVFTDKVLPKYLPAVDARSSTKYPSFTRKLNRWGFRQATRGPDTGAFHHPCFRRDMPDLCLEMVCQRSRDRSTKGEKKLKQQPPTTSCDDHTKSTVTPLTQAALESVATSCPPKSAKSVSVVSVSDDSRSVSSSSNSSAQSNMPQSVMIQTLPQGTISTDAQFVQATLKRRDELERLMVAKCMLYEAYLKALRGE